MKSLRGERDAIERQRAALLSARSIEHVQRELAAVQQKLEQATSGALPARSRGSGRRIPDAGVRLFWHN